MAAWNRKSQGDRHRVICAPDSFKETISAGDAAKAMADGIRAADPSIVADICPVSDGGEGALLALAAAMGATIRTVTVTGPMGDPIEARFGVVPEQNIGIVELAEASGLSLVPPEFRDPAWTTALGTGELVRHAVQCGCTTIILCIGGSATVDGGAGIIQGLGGKFFDRNGRHIEEPMTGATIGTIARIDTPAQVPRIRVACDVDSPLCGPNGAAVMYGPQKGASPDQVKFLDTAMTKWAWLTRGDPEEPGSGAAGGAGFGLRAICGASLEPGIDLILEALRFAERCEGAALVLTGEGRLDAQTLNGKACMGVAKVARRAGVNTVAIVGSTGDGAEDCLDSHKGGLLSGFFNLSERFGEDRARNDTRAALEEAATNVVRQWVR